MIWFFFFNLEALLRVGRVWWLRGGALSDVVEGCGPLKTRWSLLDSSAVS